jgi:hypothetical protein
MTSFLSKYGNTFSWLSLFTFWVVDIVARAACNLNYIQCISYCEYPPYVNVLIFSLAGLFLLCALLVLASIFVGGIRRHGWIALALSVASLFLVFSGYWDLFLATVSGA